MRLRAGAHRIGEQLARCSEVRPTRRSDLDRSWVVEASAGTGKTTALVDRIVEVIAAGTPVETIVAVTFTHAAAGNMKLRVRHELEQRRAARTRPRGAGAPGRSGALAGPRLHRHHPRVLRAIAAPPSGGGRRRSRVSGTGAARRAARLRRRVPALDRAAPGLAFARAGRARSRASPGARSAMAPSRSTRCATPPGPWPSGAISTRPGTSAPSIAMPPWRPSSSRPRARWRCAIAVRVRGFSLRGLRPWREFLQRVQRARDAGLFDANVIENEMLRLPRTCAGSSGTASTATA